jgi:hypothetical protein
MTTRSIMDQYIRTPKTRDSVEVQALLAYNSHPTYQNACKIAFDSFFGWNETQSS